MDTDRKRQLKDQYKHQRNVGAVYVLACSGNHRRWIRATTDIHGILSRFRFAVSMKGCPDPVTRAECDRYGWESISLTVLEELEMKEDQTIEEFSDEMKLLEEMWTEKLSADDKGAK